MRVNLTLDSPHRKLGNVLHGKIITLPDSDYPDEAFLTTDEKDSGFCLIVSMEGVIHRFSPESPAIVHGELTVET
jgi:hypothetical protein